MTSKYDNWTREQITDKIEAYWLEFYNVIDARDINRAREIVFAIKQLLEYRDIKL